LKTIEKTIFLSALEHIDFIWYRKQGSEDRKKDREKARKKEKKKLRKKPHTKEKEKQR
jgi:hypothetical protein